MQFERRHLVLAAGIAAAGVLPLAVSNAAAQTGTSFPTTYESQSMSNKQLVKTAMTELFGNRDITALERYWDAAYVQHNPKMPNGVEFLKKMIPALPAAFTYEAGLVVEDGEFVMAHGRYVGWAPRPMIAVDIFRVRHGKLVEHWDVIQEEVPAAQAASGNPMFPAH